MQRWLLLSPNRFRAEKQRETKAGARAGVFARAERKEWDIYEGTVREMKLKKKNTLMMRSADGKRRGTARKTKGEAMTGPGAKNVKSVHKYRGPYHITTVTGPLTPAVPVAMDTSQLGPFLHPIPSSGLSFRHLTWPPEIAVIIRLSKASAASTPPGRQRLRPVTL